jgi:hypothetical protein
MPNTKLMFFDSDFENQVTLETFFNTKNELTICMVRNGFPPISISLNKETAVKLVRTMKREISKIEQS